MALEGAVPPLGETLSHWGKEESCALALQFSRVLPKLEITMDWEAEAPPARSTKLRREGESWKTLPPRGVNFKKTGTVKVFVPFANRINSWDS